MSPTGSVDVQVSFLPGPLRFLPGGECDAALQATCRMLARWPCRCRPSPARDARPPLLVVQPLAGGGFRLHGASPEATDFTPASPGRKGCLLAPGYSFDPTVTCLISTLAIELVSVHEALNTSCMGVHGAAVSRNGRTLLLCGSHRAGKSALVTELMLAGWQGMGDDMLGLSPGGEVVSYGIAPRLRLPLPPSARLSDFLAQPAHVASADGEYLCCDPLTLPLLPPGARLAVSGIVLLDRQDTVPEGGASDKPCGLLAPAGYHGLWAMLRRFLLRDGKAGQALATASALMERVPCRILRYRTLDEAVRLLDDWPGDSSAASAATAGALVATDGASPDPRLRAGRHRVPRRQSARRATAVERAPACGTLWRQRPDVIFRQQAGGGFLARDEQSAGQEGRIFQLNGMGCVLWQLWETPCSETELAALLGEAFPHVGAGTIRQDVQRLRQRLCAAGFLEATPSPEG